MAFSTGVSLLTINPNILTLKSGLQGYWDFENTLNSYTGATPYFFNGVIDSGTNDPNKDISLSTVTPKIGTYSLLTIAQGAQVGGDTYRASVKASVSISKDSGTFVGWTRVVKFINGGENSAFFSSFPAIGSTSSTVSDMGITITGSSVTNTTANVRFSGGTNVATVDPTQWFFVCYWWDFSDKSQGANGSQYFQINNGTIYGRQTPAQPTLSMTLISAPSFVKTDSLSPNYSNGAQADAVGVYNRVLTSQERSNLYNSGSGLSYSQLY